MRMAAIYGHRWTSLFTDEDAINVAKSEWSDALAPLSDWQIANGFTKCRRLSDWQPTIPEFLRLACNLPDRDTAVSRVLKREVIDPASRNIIKKMGSYELNSLSNQLLIKRINSIYQDAYSDALDEVIGITAEWKPPVAIVHDKNRVVTEPHDPERMKEAIDKLKKAASGEL